jgi:hypothetical protein
MHDGAALAIVGLPSRASGAIRRLTRHNPVIVRGNVGPPVLALHNLVGEADVSLNFIA